MLIKHACPLILISTLIWGGQVVEAGIVNSVHDFSQSAWSQGKLCAVCHGNPAYLPPGGAEQILSLQQEGLVPSDLTPESLICLGCHDVTSDDISEDNLDGQVFSFQPLSFHTSGLGSTITIGVGSQFEHKRITECSNCHDIHNPEKE